MQRSNGAEVRFAALTYFRFWPLAEGLLSSSKSPKRTSNGASRDSETQGLYDCREYLWVFAASALADLNGRHLAGLASTWPKGQNGRKGIFPELVQRNCLPGDTRRFRPIADIRAWGHHGHHEECSFRV